VGTVSKIISRTVLIMERDKLNAEGTSGFTTNGTARSSHVNRVIIGLKVSSSSSPPGQRIGFNDRARAYAPV